MEMRHRPHHATLILIAALHVGLLALVLTKPKMPAGGAVTYMNLLRVAPPVAMPRPADRPAPAAATPPRRRQVAPAAPAAAPVQVAQEVGSSAALDSAAAPDFAAASAPLNLDQLRRQVALNERDRVKTPMEKVHDEELRRKSVETTVAAAAAAGARKDCQNGYSGMGIFALIPIIYGTVTDKGCKWK